MLEKALRATPYPLRKLKAWACYKDSLNKAPISAYSENGGGAMSNNPQTWASWQEACDVAQRYGYEGLCIATGGNLVAVDIDDCFDSQGRISKEAEDIVRKLNSYTEKSVSGKGLHVFCFGTKPGKDSKNGKFEMYSENHFMILSGDVYGSYKPIRNATPELKQVYDRFIRKEHVTAKPSFTTRGGVKEIPDNDLMAIISHSKSGLKFDKLMSGDWSDYKPNRAGTASSEADYALCRILAYFSNSNESQMERMFAGSGLYRGGEKGKYYVRDTVKKAAEEQRGRGNFYNQDYYFRSLSSKKNDNMQH